MAKTKTRRLRPGLTFTPDETFEWALWCRAHDPARWAGINERARKAVEFYELARAHWMATDDDEPAGGEPGVHA